MEYAESVWSCFHALHPFSSLEICYTMSFYAVHQSVNLQLPPLNH